MKRSTKIWIATGIVVVGGAVGFGAWKKNTKKLTEVTIGDVERTDLVSKVSSNGKIEAKRKVDLSANVPGQVVNLAVREGDLVKKGDFLLQIDRAQHAASAAGAEASLNAILHDRDAARASAQEARTSWERTKKSYDERLLPEADLERAKAALDSALANVAAAEGRIAQARASLAGARDTLSKTTIRAPMDGIVTALPVEEGEVAVIGTMNNPGTVLITISDMSVVEAVMDVDETDVPAVKLGQKANVTIDAYPNQTFPGKISEVGSSPRRAAQGGAGTSDAVNFEVKIQLDDPPADVRPGFSVSADIVTGTRQAAIAVPIQALVVRDKPGDEKGSVSSQEEGVYLFEETEQKIAFKPVTTGISGDTLTEVTTGVTAGQKIVTGPFKALREIKDGDKVKVEEKKGGDKKKD